MKAGPRGGGVATGKRSAPPSRTAWEGARACGPRGRPSETEPTTGSRYVVGWIDPARGPLRGRSVRAACWSGFASQQVEVCLISDHGELIDRFTATPDRDGPYGLARRVAVYGEPVRAVRVWPLERCSSLYRLITRPVTINFLPDSRCRVKRQEPELFTPVTSLRRLTRQRSPGSSVSCGVRNLTREVANRLAFKETSCSARARGDEATASPGEAAAADRELWPPSAGPGVYVRARPCLLEIDGSANGYDRRRP
jgi:hypothetical protein